MCGRFALFCQLAELVRQFGLNEFPSDLAPRYNIAPGQLVAVISAPRPDWRRLSLMRWGLIPHWTKEPPRGARLINARGETVTEKPAFRSCFQERRCLVPASGFYEWQRRGGKRRPHFIASPNGDVLALAGLWDRWRTPDGTIVESCSIITTDANRTMASVHERMPVIIEPADHAAWLTGRGSALPRLRALLRPAPEKSLAVTPVSMLVNDARCDGPGCVAADGGMPFG